MAVPVALTSPPVYKLPPVTLPVTLTLVPVAAPMLGVVNVALAGIYNSLLPLIPIVLAPEVSILTLNCVPLKVNALPAVYCPAPENCTQLIAVVPITIGVVSLLVHVQPVSAYSVPS